VAPGKKWKAARLRTAVSTTDVHEGWRGHRCDGGVVCDVASSEIAIEE
jgi:hypothetical protein